MMAHIVKLLFYNYSHAMSVAHYKCNIYQTKHFYLLQTF